ncbi:MAG TPA: hypothetical protein VFS07_06570, partial [Gemmatimonadales bacterium]|nr:hypothetical protein [Gemmatimonadales bacterium]
MTGTARALAQLGAPLRGWPAAARLLGGAGCAVGALALAAWGARLGWVDGATWVALAWGAALAALGLAAALAVRATRRGGPAAVARWLEESGRWRRGALAGLLGDAAPGTSGELFAAADGAAERTLRTEGPVLLAARVATARRAAARGAGVLLLAAAGLAAARPTSGRAALLWQPRAAWREATAPFRLRGPDAAVPRGAPVTLELTAPGRRRAILWLRAPGETWRGVAVALDSAGRGRYQTAPLESDLFARFTAGGRGSDTLAIHVLLPAFVGQVTVTAHYPAYLRLDPEPLPLDGDTILLPLGARLVTAGEATAELGAAAWVGPRGPAPLAVQGATFRGAFEPRGAGSWRLDLTTADGAPLAGEAVTLPVRVVADSAPEVAIPVPGVDTLIPIDLRLPLVIEARDDHGLARLTVESERLAAGAPAGAVRQEVPLEQGLPDHAVVPLVLDLTDRGLLPGDSVRVVVQAEDAAPVAHRARSRAYLFRLARPDELRAAARAASAAIGTALDSAAARSRRLERATGDLAQERDRAASGGNDAADQALDYDAARRAEQVAHDQQEMVAQAEALRRQVEELQRAAEASGASDPEWQRQLEEIRRELDRALTPELRERLAGLQRALADLDAERAREALKDLTAEQQRLREALERSRELFRRAAVEGDLANLAAEA